MIELPKLTPDERREILDKIWELDGADWLDSGELTNADRALIEQRLAEHEGNPDATIAWELKPVYSPSLYDLPASAPSAQVESERRLWYEERQAGRGGAFIWEVRQAVNALKPNPHRRQRRCN